ncbi:MAG: hypothetical protein ACJAVI_005914 [Candidatus Azotimanducaceae bacterium]
MTRLTIGAGCVKALLELAVDKGTDRRALLKRANTMLSESESRDNRILRDSYQWLKAAGKSLCDEPALALLLGEAASLFDFWAYL